MMNYTIGLGNSSNVATTLARLRFKIESDFRTELLINDNFDQQQVGNFEKVKIRK